MNRLVFLAVLLLSFSTTVMSQDNNYTSLWKEVNKLLKDGKMASANDRLDQLYELASNDNDYDQMVKTLLTQSGVKESLEEDHQVNDIYRYEQRFNETPDPVLKSLFANILAKKYSQYLQYNSYRFYNRTQIQNRVDGDILTYSVSDLIEKSNSYYLESIKSKVALKKVKSNEVKEILGFNKKDLIEESDLYVLLCLDVLRHFRATSNLVNEFGNNNSLNQEQLFGSITEFKAIDFQVNQEDGRQESYTKQVAMLYQTLLIEYENSNNLIEEKVNLLRLRFMKQHANLTELDKKHLNALVDYHSSTNGFTHQLVGDELLKVYLSQLTNNHSGIAWSDEKKGLLARTLKLINEQKESKNSEFKQTAKEAMEQLEKRELHVQLEKIVPSSEEVLAYVSYKNINRLNNRIIKIDSKELQELQRLVYEEKFNKLEKYPAVTEWSDNLPSGNDYMNHSIEIVIPALMLDTYVLLSFDGETLSKSGIVVATPLIVSDLAYNFESTNGDHQLVVVDRTTGQPQSNITIEAFARGYDRQTRKNKLELIYTGESGKDGVAQLDILKDVRRNNIHIKLSKGKDVLEDQEAYTYLSSENKRGQQRSILWFTDRSIYRPGQIVHYKGIVMDIDEEGMPSIVYNESLNLSLKDANSQVVESTQLTTDEYGSVFGTFIIPSSGLNGNFSLGTDNPWSYKYVKVEDYKRPKFQPSFEKSTEAFKLGDSIELSAIAKSYAGIKLDGAKYSYTVFRESYYPWYRTFYWCGYNPLPRSERIMINQSDGIVDEDGKISIQFFAESDPLLSSGRLKPNYKFTIQLDVTDIDGETRSENKTIYLSKQEYSIELKHPSHLPKGESAELGLNITNFDGEKVDKNGQVLIFKVEDYKTGFKDKLWPYPEFHSLAKDQYESKFPHDLYEIKDHPYQQEASNEIESIDFNTKDSIQLKLPSLRRGLYVVKLKVDGEIQEQSSYIQIFDDLIVGNPELKILGNLKEYNVGDKASLKIYASHDNAEMFYRIYKQGKSYKYDWIQSTDQLIESIDEASYGNMKVSSFYVKNNRHYTDEQLINVPWKQKDLEITYTTFRDNVLPGSDEEFSLKIKGNGELKNQMTLAMYDASLDVFSENNWNTFTYPTFNYFSRSSYFSFGMRTGQLMSKYDNNYFDYSLRTFFPRLLTDKTSGYGLINQFGGGRSGGKARSGRMQKSASNKEYMALESAPAAMMDAVSVDENVEYDTEQTSLENNVDQKEVVDTAPPIRKNLNETVFFYPNVETDKNGELTYSFKMNEAITEWKLMSFAHNKEMQFGQEVRTLVTKKDLLIQANMPRFLRAGDETLFTAKVSNLSTNELNGEAKIEIINAVTLESVLDLLTADVNKAFTIKEDGSETVEWQLNIPEDFVMPVIIKVYAIAGQHSDGEQNMLPVLTNRKLITSTKSMMIRPNETKEFDFAHLLENVGGIGVESHNYQIEFTTNPIWFAIKAMPYLSVRNNDCTTNYADQIFGNALASHIINQNPIIKGIFNQWSNDPEALKSELSKNEELKEALLAETPWVRQAQSEEQQRRDIALLFDVNKLANEFSANVQALSNRQSSNGGFSWTAGGRDNRYTTQYVMEQLLKLKNLTGVENNLVNNMIQRGMNYLTERVKEDYKRLKITDKSNLRISYLVVHYSYLHSLYDGKLFGEIGSEAKVLYKSKFKKYWKDLSPYGQAMIGLAHLRSGNDDLSTLILESLQERAIRNPELGAYWKNNGYAWYSLGIEQQSLLIEFFEEADIDQDLVDELKMWLLTKKQTTHWPTSKSTSAAIYALVNNNEDKLDPSSKIELWLSGDQQEVNDQEAGTGYFEIKYDGKVVNKDFGKIKVKNPNEQLVWGAAYWQYWNDLDKIKSAEENPFTIKKEVFLETLNDKGIQLKAIGESDTLVQGDKLIVRVELRTDRDLDYVHMRDMRAAGLEPLNTLSQYKYQDGLSYYETTRDRYTDFFFERMKRGTYVFEYELRVTHRGMFSNGVTTAQCMYAPAFAGHSEGIKLGFR